MMESPPAAALIMAEADFLLEVAVIVLDTPAQLLIGAFPPATVRQASLGRLRANASTLPRGGFCISWLKRLERRK